MVKRLLLAIVSVVLLAGSPAFAGRQHLNREARTDDLTTWSQTRNKGHAQTRSRFRSDNLRKRWRRP